MKVAILATPLATKIPIVKDAYYIGVDAGVLRLIEQGIHPDMAVGDFDSMNQEQFRSICEKFVIEKHPVQKDESDTELAIMIAKEKGFEKIIVVGAFGKRVDHTIANIRLLAYRWHDLYLLDENQCMFYLKEGEHEIETTYPNVSFFAIGETIISLEGFMYPLDHRKICESDIYTLSNTLIEKKGKVKVEQGAVLCVLTNE